MNASDKGLRLTTDWRDEYRAGVVDLLRAYQEELGVSLETQGFAAELAALPGAYQPPAGALVLALEEQGANVPARVVGVVGLRPLEQGVCEMKRLYVAREARGMGLGLRLCERLCAEARRIGYGVMRLDTLERLRPAGRIYRKMGFRPCADYNGNPIPGVTFFELDLREARPEIPPS